MAWSLCPVYVAVLVCVVYVMPVSPPLPRAAGVITSGMVELAGVGRWSPELVVALGLTPGMFWESCRSMRCNDSMSKVTVPYIPWRMVAAAV